MLINHFDHIVLFFFNKLFVREKSSLLTSAEQMCRTKIFVASLLFGQIMMNRKLSPQILT